MAAFELNGALSSRTLCLCLTPEPGAPSQEEIGGGQHLDLLRTRVEEVRLSQPRSREAKNMPGLVPFNI